MHDLNGRDCKNESSEGKSQKERKRVELGSKSRTDSRHFHGLKSLNEKEKSSSGRRRCILAWEGRQEVGCGIAASQRARWTRCRTKPRASCVVHEGYSRKIQMWYPFGGEVKDLETLW